MRNGSPAGGGKRPRLALRIGTRCPSEEQWPAERRFSPANAEAWLLAHAIVRGYAGRLGKKLGLAGIRPR